MKCHTLEDGRHFIEADCLERLFNVLPADKIEAIANTDNLNRDLRELDDFLRWFNGTG